jgi:hypothetical protein
LARTIDARGSLSVSGAYQRDGAITAVRRKGPSDVRVLAAGHVTLPFRDGAMLRAYAGGPADPVEATSRELPYLVDLQLAVGALDGFADCGVATSVDAAQFDPVHPATGSPPPFTVRSEPLTAGDPVFQWSRVRQKLIAGVVDESSYQPVALGFSDGESNVYLRPIAVYTTSGAFFSIEGDSGSLVIDAHLNAVGIAVGRHYATGDAPPLSYVVGVRDLKDALRDHFASFFVEA